MRILCASDAHGNIRNLITAIDDLKPNAVIFTGDGSREVENLSYTMDIPFYIVKGNCDFGDYEPLIITEIKGKRFFITHGHLYSVKYDLSEITRAGISNGADVVVFGHTHNPVSIYENGLLLFNPGSISCPNSGKPSCGYIDIVGNSVTTNTVYY